MFVCFLGPGGQRICHVRENPLIIPVPKLADMTKPLLTDPRFTIDFTPNSSNDTLLQSYAERIQVKQRRERLLPPIPGWNPTGMVKSIVFLIQSILFFSLSLSCLSLGR